LAFNKTVVTRYRIFLEQAHYASSTINLQLAAVRRLAYEAADAGAESRPCRRNSTSQGRQEVWCSDGQLANRRTRETCAWRYSTATPSGESEITPWLLCCWAAGYVAAEVTALCVSDLQQREDHGADTSSSRWRVIPRPCSRRGTRRLFRFPPCGHFRLSGLSIA
jgi:hypothetical protein